MSKTDDIDQRKVDHVKLAFESSTDSILKDERFYYEPMISSHPKDNDDLKTNFLDFCLDYPIWISSMTGGGNNLKLINNNLARLCRDFKLGFSTGSCRPLFVNKKKFFEDFDWRDFVGTDRPFFTNLGLAQLQELKSENNINQLDELLDELRVDGLVIHVNPLQEWFQDGGDRFNESPMDTIDWLLNKKKNKKIIIKEVGHGIGPESLKELIQRSIDSIDFAAFGGTNFSLLESKRGKVNRTTENPLMYVGHSSLEMIKFIKDIDHENKSKLNYIISGGVKNFLDGYYLINQLDNSIYGMASVILKYALKDYETLYSFFNQHVSNLKMAKSFLKVKKVDND